MNDQQPKRPERSATEHGSVKTPGDGEHREEESLDLRSARTLSTVASVAGPVSLIIGGIALSTVAIVCAIVALVKINRALRQDDSSQRAYAFALRRTAFVSIAIGLIALILNVVSVAMVLPTLLEAMRSGDYSAILGDAAASLQNSSQPSTGGNAWG